MCPPAPFVSGTCLSSLILIYMSPPFHRWRLVFEVLPRSFCILFFFFICLLFNFGVILVCILGTDREDREEIQVMDAIQVTEMKGIEKLVNLIFGFLLLCHSTVYLSLLPALFLFFLFHNPIIRTREEDGRVHEEKGPDHCLSPYLPCLVPFAHVYILVFHQLIDSERQDIT